MSILQGDGHGEKSSTLSDLVFVALRNFSFRASQHPPARVRLLPSSFFEVSQMFVPDAPHFHLDERDRHERSGPCRGVLLHDIPRAWPGVRGSGRRPLLPGNDLRFVHVHSGSSGDLTG